MGAAEGADREPGFDGRKGVVRVAGRGVRICEGRSEQLAQSGHSLGKATVGEQAAEADLEVDAIQDLVASVEERSEALAGCIKANA